MQSTFMSQLSWRNFVCLHIDMRVTARKKNYLRQRRKINKSEQFFEDQTFTSTGVQIQHKTT